MLAVGRPDLFREWKVVGVEAKGCSGEGGGGEDEEEEEGGDDGGGAVLDRRGEPCDGRMSVVSVMSEGEWMAKEGLGNGERVTSSSTDGTLDGSQWSGLVRIPSILDEEDVLETMHALLCSVRTGSLETVAALASPNATIAWGFVPWLVVLFMLALVAGAGFNRQVMAFINCPESLPAGADDIAGPRVRPTGRRKRTTGGGGGGGGGGAWLAPREKLKEKGG
jgi:hypothetical protein